MGILIHFFKGVISSVFYPPFLKYGCFSFLRQCPFLLFFCKIMYSLYRWAHVCCRNKTVTLGPGAEDVCPWMLIAEAWEFVTASDHLQCSISVLFLPIHVNEKKCWTVQIYLMWGSCSRTLWCRYCACPFMFLQKCKWDYSLHLNLCLH